MSLVSALFHISFVNQLYLKFDKCFLPTLAGPDNNLMTSSPVSRDRSSGKTTSGSVILRHVTTEDTVLRYCTEDTVLRYCINNL